MTQNSPGSLDQRLYFLTQGTVPNLHQIQFFIFCVNKGFRFMLVYSCLHYLLFKNEKVFCIPAFIICYLRMRKFFCFLRSNVSPVSTIKQDSESGVVSLRWTEIPDQNLIVNLNILAATIRSFKRSLITFWIWHPPSPLAPYPSLKRKRRRRNCFKIPTSTGIVVAHVVIANTPSKFFTNFLSFDWDLLAFSFQIYFCFHPPPPLLKSSHWPKLTECEPCFATSKES